MSNYEIVGWLAVLFVVLSGAIFFLSGYLKRKEPLTLEGYLLAGRTMSGRAFANTSYAAGVSLASNILFFIEHGNHYGFLMGTPIITALISTIAMFWAVRYIKIDFTKTRTLTDVWYKVFPSMATARTFSVVLALAGVIFVFFEIYVGMHIVTMFLPKTPYTTAVSFFVVGCLVMSYVYFGGLKAIVVTDKWQMYLIACATTALIYFVVNLETLPTSQYQTGLSQLFAVDLTTKEAVIFFSWVFFLNLIGTFGAIGTWQAMAASRSLTESLNAYLRRYALYFYIFIGTMMTIIVTHAKGYKFGTIETFTRVIFDNTELAYIVVPVICLGFSAAMLSTADSVLMSSMFTLVDKNGFLPSIESLDENQKTAKLRKYLIIFMITTIFFFSLMLFLVNTDIGAYILPFVQSIWGLGLFLSVYFGYAFFTLVFKGNLFSATKTQVTMFFVTFAIALLFGVVYPKIQEIIQLESLVDLYVSCFVPPILAALNLVGMVVVEPSKSKESSPKIAGSF